MSGDKKSSEQVTDYKITHYDAYDNIIATTDETDASYNESLNVANNMLKFLNSGILTTSYTDIYLSSLKEDVNDPFGHDGDWVRQGGKNGKKSFVYTWWLKTDDGGINWYFPTPTPTGGSGSFDAWSDESTHAIRLARFSIDYLEQDGDGSDEHAS